MSVIVPTVTAQNQEDFDSQIKLVTSFASRIHIDIMDGLLAPTVSPVPEIICTPMFTKIDIHIMFKNPIDILDRVISWSPNLVIVHAESEINIKELRNILPNNINLGVAILPDTNTETIYQYLEYLNHVLIFGGHLGYHGGEADLNQLKKARQIKNINPNIETAWDGGANLDNINVISNAGIDIINVGSAIHNSENPRKIYYGLANKLRGK
jgi:ribulose-phosphate 3-epimerase